MIFPTIFQYQPTPAESGTRAHAPLHHTKSSTAILQNIADNCCQRHQQHWCTFFLFKSPYNFSQVTKFIKRLQEQFLTYSYVCKIYCKPNIFMYKVFVLPECIPTPAMAQSCRLKSRGWPKFYWPAEDEILQAFQVIKIKCSHTFI